jgi:hypothetical protein
MNSSLFAISQRRVARLTVEKVQGVAEGKRKVAEFPEIRT